MSRMMLVLIGCLLVVAGCGKKAAVSKAPAPGNAPTVNEAAQFDDALSCIQQRQDEAYAALIKGIGWKGTPNLDAASIQKSLDDFGQAARKSLGDLKEVKVPELKGAPELYAASERYYRGEESVAK